jgi:FMN phosphatase YigB (HAD superfamily)
VDGSLFAHAGTIYMDYYRTHWTWIEGAKVAYERIKEHYSTGIITNGFAETQWLKIKQFGFEECAPAIIISEELGVMKPHQKIFTEAAKRAQTRPEQILYVGDSLSSDVDGALEAGWSVAWFNPKKNSAEGRNPTFEFADFETLVSLLI